MCILFLFKEEKVNTWRIQRIFQGHLQSIETHGKVYLLCSEVLVLGVSVRGHFCRPAEGNFKISYNTGKLYSGEYCA